LGEAGWGDFGGIRWDGVDAINAVDDQQNVVSDDAAANLTRAGSAE